MRVAWGPGQVSVRVTWGPGQVGSIKVSTSVEFGSSSAAFALTSHPALGRLAHAHDVVEADHANVQVELLRLCAAVALFVACQAMITWGPGLVSMRVT